MKTRHYLLILFFASLLFTGFEYINFSALEKDMDVLHTINGSGSKALQDAANSKKAFGNYFIIIAIAAGCFIVYTYRGSFIMKTKSKKQSVI